MKINMKLQVNVIKNRPRNNLLKVITNFISLEKIIIKGFESLIQDPLEVKILIDLKK